MERRKGKWGVGGGVIRGKEESMNRYKGRKGKCASAGKRKIN